MPMETKERECQETYCDLCGEGITEKQIFNFHADEWDTICDECYDWEITEQCCPDYNAENEGLY